MSDMNYRENIIDYLGEHQKDFVGKRVLVAEGSAANREITRKILEKQGFVVDVATDGDEGKNKIEAAGSVGQNYSAVLLDSRMTEIEAEKIQIPVITLNKPIDIPLMLADLAKEI